MNTIITGQGSAQSGLDHFVRMAQLHAVLLFCQNSRILTTYKPVAAACGWYHRDVKFHAALGECSRMSMKSGGPAVTAIVCRAGNTGEPTIPGRQFFELLEDEDSSIVIPRLSTGEYTPDGMRQAWLDQLAKLGFDISKL